MDTKLRNLVAAQIAIVTVCIFVSLHYGTGITENIVAGRALIDTTFGYSVMTISVALLTFFGLLDLPGGRDADGEFTSQRLRLCITVTLVVLFITYFGTTGYWDEHEVAADFPKLMMQTLGGMLSVVIPFYFGTTAAVEIFKDRNGTARDAVSKGPEQDAKM